MTKLVLVNAIYFKGDWLRKFDSNRTKVEPFYLGSKDKRRDVYMMRNNAKYRYGSVEDLDSRIVELPYAVIINDNNGTPINDRVNILPLNCKLHRLRD